MEHFSLKIGLIFLLLLFFFAGGLTLWSVIIKSQFKDLFIPFLKKIKKNIFGENVTLNCIVFKITEENEPIYSDNYPNSIFGSESVSKRYYCIISFIQETLAQNIFSFEINGKKNDIENRSGIYLFSRVKIRCRKWGNHIFFKKIISVS